VLGSSFLSVCGACIIIFSALRLRELSKRFFAIRLIFFLALTDLMAAAFNIIGAIADIQQLFQPESKEMLLCELQATGLLYFNLASIMWTSCPTDGMRSASTSSPSTRCAGRCQLCSRAAAST